MIALHGSYNINIINADDTPRPVAWIKPERRLNWYLMVCSMAGDEDITVAGKPYHIPQGSTYLIPPGVPSFIGSQKGNRPAWLHFHVQWNEQRDADPRTFVCSPDWQERAHLKQPDPHEVWGVDLPVVIPDSLRELFAESVPRIVRCWKRHTPLDMMESRHALGGLQLALVTSVSSRNTPPATFDTETRIARAEAVALESLSSVFGVSEFAAAAGLSRSRFSVLYHQHRGITPAVFLREARLRQAEAMLSSTKLPVEEVGKMVGYRDPSVFGRVFRRAHGCAPSVWRENT